MGSDSSTPALLAQNLSKEGQLSYEPIFSTVITWRNNDFPNRDVTSLITRNEKHKDAASHCIKVLRALNHPNIVHYVSSPTPPWSGKQCAIMTLPAVVPLKKPRPGQENGKVPSRVIDTFTFSELLWGLGGVVEAVSMCRGEAVPGQTSNPTQCRRISFSRLSLSQICVAPALDAAGASHTAAVIAVISETPAAVASLNKLRSSVHCDRWLLYDVSPSTFTDSGHADNNLRAVALLLLEALVHVLQNPTLRRDLAGGDPPSGVEDYIDQYLQRISQLVIRQNTGSSAQATPQPTEPTPPHPVPAPLEEKQTPTKPTPSPELESLRLRVERFYSHYSPEKAQYAHKAVAAYRGRESELIPALVAKYGPEPEAATESLPEEEPTETNDREQLEVAREEGEEPVEDATVGDGPGNADPAPETEVATPSPTKDIVEEDPTRTHSYLTLPKDAVATLESMANAFSTMQPPPSQETPYRSCWLVSVLVWVHRALDPNGETAAVEHLPAFVSASASDHLFQIPSLGGELHFLRSLLVLHSRQPLCAVLEEAVHLHHFFDGRAQSPSKVAGPGPSTFGELHSTDNLRLTHAYESIHSSTKTLMESGKHKETCLVERRILPWLLHPSHLCQKGAAALFSYLFEALPSYSSVGAALIASFAVESLERVNVEVRLAVLRYLSPILGSKLIVARPFLFPYLFTNFLFVLHDFRITHLVPLLHGDAKNKSWEDTSALEQTTGFIIAHIKAMKFFLLHLIQNPGQNPMPTINAASTVGGGLEETRPWILISDIAVPHLSIFTSSVVDVCTLAGSGNSTVGVPVVSGVLARVISAVIGLVVDLWANAPSGAGAMLVQMLCSCVYYGSAESREVALNALLGHLVKGSSISNLNPSGPETSTSTVERTSFLSYEDIVRLWLPIFVPLTGEREVGIRRPSCQIVAALLDLVRPALQLDSSPSSQPSPLRTATATEFQFRFGVPSTSPAATPKSMIALSEEKLHSPLWKPNPQYNDVEVHPAVGFHSWWTKGVALQFSSVLYTKVEEAATNALPSFQVLTAKDENPVRLIAAPQGSTWSKYLDSPCPSLQSALWSYDSASEEAEGLIQKHRLDNTLMPQPLY
jgi:hypothetical protein